MGRGMTDVAVYEASTPVPVRDQLEALKSLIAPDCSDAELDLFAKVCDRTGLDPFARQIYAVSRYDKQAGRKKMGIQTSIDGFRLIAQRSGQYAGQLGPYWCGRDGKWIDVWLEATPPAAAKVGALRAGFVEPVWGVARFDAYAQTKSDGTLTHMWAAMADVMLAKCAEALALRKAFPQELSGLYTGDEMGQVDNSRMGDEGRPALMGPPPDEPIPTKKAELMAQVVADSGCSIAEVIRLATDGRTEDPAELWQSQVAAAQEVWEELKLQAAEAPFAEAEVGAPLIDPDEPQNLESDAPKPSSEPITEPQLRKLSAALRERGIVGDQRHEYLSELLGRTVESTKDLSKVEASRAIDELGKQEAER